MLLTSVRVTILGSGSEGNATLFECAGTRVLVDAGLSLKKTCRAALNARGTALEHLDALIVTHAHSDHVAHAKRIAKKFACPVYVQAKTLERVELGATRTELYEPHGRFRIGALGFSMMPIPHDTPQVAIVVRDRDDCVGLVTDLGHVPRKLAGHLHHCRTLLIESNHDPQLLAIAPYPLFVRTRIAGAHGHLANAQTARLLRRLAKPPLERVVLMHLSRKANSPQKAFRIAQSALGDHEAELLVASQHQPLLLDETEATQLSLAL